MENEITHGWDLSLPPNFAHTTPDAEVAPHDCLTHATINELGEIMEKDRVTHYQSFPGAFSDTSVNGRVIYEELLTYFYGHMNLGTIHYIVGCCMYHPRRWIWISKIDWKSAYRRQHLNAKTVVKSLTQVCINGINLLLAALRLTFGGNLCPSERGCISETVADLATNILHCDEWDPSEIHSPLRHMLSKPKPLLTHIPLPLTRI